LNNPLKARSIDQLKGFFLPGEKIAGGLFDVFDNFLGVFEGKVLLLDRNDREIDQEAQKPDPSIFFSDGDLFHLGSSTIQFNFICANLPQSRTGLRAMS
jgi:hypothetical protein